MCISIYMTDNKKKKKVNQLNIQECKDIITRLNGQNENKYYNEVLKRYSKLSQL